MGPACGLLAELLRSPTALAIEEPGPTETPKIRDNVFLLEEAYNQEPGVIQHIQSFVVSARSKAWSYSFTEEWPVPTDLHQASFTIPATQPEGSRPSTGDVLLNYRIQAVGVGGTGAVAFAPRLSLVLPTGDYRTGAGRGGYGVQMNLPSSLELGDYVVIHPNAGATVTPKAKSPGGTQGTAIDAAGGFSFVALALPWFNPMVEVAYFGGEDLADDGSKSWGHQGVVSPGMRFALNFDSGLQIVPGVAAPIGISEDGTELSVLTYLSFEHPAFTAPGAVPEREQARR